MNAPTIVFLCLTSSAGGIDRVISSMLSSPPPPNVKQLLICRDLPDLFNNIQHFHWLSSIKYPYTKKFGRFWPFADWKIIRKIAALAASSPHVIINPHDYLSLYYAVIAKKMLRAKIAIIPSVHQLPESRPIGTIKKRIFRFIDRIILHQVDGVIAVSKGRKAQLVGVGIQPERIRVIYNGVDTTDHYSTPAKKLEARKNLNIPTGKICFGYGGRLSPEKGPQVLIQAIAEIPNDQLENMFFLIAGSGPLGAALQAEVRSRQLDQHIGFTGYLREMEQFYNSINILIQPSLDEGISMTILEAMSYGIPVIASRVGGNPELVVDGQIGWLVNKNDAEALQAAIVSAVQDPDEIQRRGSLARGWVQNNFSLRKMVQDTYTYLVECIEHA